MKNQNKELDELLHLHRTIKERKLAYKINAIILLKQGYTYEKVAEVLLIGQRTIKRYNKIYSKKGIDGLMLINYKGCQSKLTTEQETLLTQYLEENLISASKQIVEFVRNKFGIQYTPEGLVHTLKRLGYSYKKTKLVPSKADKNKQEEFIKEYKERKKALKPFEKIYFMDGVHPTHNVMPAYAWIKKGKERTVKSNSGRQRININGVYCPDDGEIIIRKDERINAQSTIKLLKSIEKKHPELTKIFVIRDNAMYYKAKLVNEYIKTSKIEFMPLPTYSPNLNLIERLWKYFKKNVMYNKYYETFEEFKIAVNKFFEKDVKKKKNKAEIMKLLTENFHVFDTS